MLIDLDPALAAPTSHPAVRTLDDGRLELRGGPERIFLDLRADRCRLAVRAGDLAAGGPRELDPRGISEFLHYGFALCPRTLWRDQYKLGVGDVVHLAPGGRPAFSVDWPWLCERSRQDQVASTDRLLALLAAAVERSIGRDPATLMLSSGKDSVALALACREAGSADVRCVTFASDEGGEARDAAAFAARLGLEHRTVLLREDPSATEEAILRYFERASEPCGDATLVPYLLAVHRAGLQPGEWIVDGLHNDSWMGYAPGGPEVRGARISDRWLSFLRPVRGWFPPESVFSAALRNRAEWHFAGGRWLRHADTRRFYPASVDTHRELARLSRRFRQLDDFDFRARVRGRHYDQNAMTVKAHVAAECYDARASFPFDDGDLAQYYFHLPEADRFDRAALQNKVLLRRMLRERLGYDDARLGKRVFEFDGPGFLLAHRKLVEHEIGSCPQWSPQVLDTLRGQLNRPAALRKTWPSLVVLFQLSGWLTRHAPEEVRA